MPFFISMCRALIVGLASLIFIGCTKKETKNLDPQTMTLEQKLERGRSIYLANCAACHNANPQIDGSIGPAVFGSSLDLIKARLMEAKYPEGYKPKKDSATMVKLPHLEKEIPFIFEFLNASQP